MKKLILIPLIFCVMIFGLVGYEKKQANDQIEIMNAEAQKTFNLFWETSNTDITSDGYGLARDRYPTNSDLSSIAATGFYLAAIPIGVENEWITYDEGYERALTSLENLSTIETINGFYYHFYNINTGEPSPNSEISIIDTSLFLAGAFVAGEYFGEEVYQIAEEIYKEINWQWFVDPVNNQFYMSYNPVTESFSGHWDYYAEGIIMYVFAAGSPTYPVNNYDSFAKEVGMYGGYEVIYSWFGSAFTYQYSHAFIDFRCYEDPNGIDWYANSVNAAYASQQYAIDSEFETLSETAFGLTASDGPNGYDGTYGAAPSGMDSHYTDGTLAPAGAIGFLPFAPEIVLPTFETYYNIEGLVGEYGFYDAYNLDTDWVDTDYILIDKGISLIMIENYKTDLIWELFMQNEYVIQGMETIGFVYNPEMQYCEQ